VCVHTGQIGVFNIKSDDAYGNQQALKVKFIFMYALIFVHVFWIGHGNIKNSGLNCCVS
jgi:hypothetical protein